MAPVGSIRQVMWWVFTGSRGGINRIRIVETICERPYNAHQLAKAVSLDYKTVRHHLDVLSRNGMVVTAGEDYGEMYFLSPSLENNLGELKDIIKKVGFKDDQK